MPKISEKRRFLKCYTNYIATEICLMQDNNKVHELLNNLLIVLHIGETSRYLMPFLRGSVPKSNNFMCNVLPNLDEDRFKQFTRVNWKTFKHIVELIKDDDVFNGAVKQHSVEFQLAVVLYRLGSSGEGATVTKMSSLFGIGNGGTIQLFTERIFKAILKLKDGYMSWPSASERVHLAEATAHELPFCIGYVDGTEVKLAEKPTNDPEAFFSRKHVYSLKVQVVCDRNLKIRHLIAGYPGSVHDARIYNNSDLALKPEDFFSGEEWIAGDSAYKLTSTVITPFRHTGPDTLSRKQFNKKFSRYRVRVEHCFMHLKERFGCLKELKIAIKNDGCIKKACIWIMVCAILHNIIIEEEERDVWPIYDDIPSEIVDELERLDASTVQGEAKRNQIMHLMGLL